MDRCISAVPIGMPKEQFHEHYKVLEACRASVLRRDRQAVAFICRPHGVKKVRLTGGEPLLRPNLSELIGEITTLDGVRRRALTTNGVLLARHAAELKASGLNRVTVSLDTLDPECVRAMSGGFRGVDQVLGGDRRGMDAGLAPIQDQLCRAAAASTITRSWIWSSDSADRRDRNASSNTWTSAIAITGVSIVS